MEDTVKKITAEYEDGETKEIQKGFLCTMAPAEDGNGVTFSFDMVSISGRELKEIIFGVVALGDKLGLFDERGIDDE